MKMKIDWENLSRNSSLSVQLLQDHPELPWDIKRLSYNPCLTFEYIFTNLDKKWLWRGISSLPWDWKGLSAH